MEHWLYLNRQQYSNPNQSYCMQWCSHGSGVCATNTHLCVCVFVTSSNGISNNTTQLVVYSKAGCIMQSCPHLSVNDTWYRSLCSILKPLQGPTGVFNYATTRIPGVSKQDGARGKTKSRHTFGMRGKFFHFLLVLGVINILKRSDGHAHNSTPPLWKKERSWKGT